MSDESGDDEGSSSRHQMAARPDYSCLSRLAALVGWDCNILYRLNYEDKYRIYVYPSGGVARPRSDDEDVYYFDRKATWNEWFLQDPFTRSENNDFFENTHTTASEFIGRHVHPDLTFSMNILMRYFQHALMLGVMRSSVVREEKIVFDIIHTPFGFRAHDGEQWNLGALKGFEPTINGMVRGYRFNWNQMFTTNSVKLPHQGDMLRKCFDADDFFSLVPSMDREYTGVQFIFVPGTVLDVLLSLPKLTPRKLLVPLVVSFTMMYVGKIEILHRSSAFQEILDFLWLADKNLIHYLDEHELDNEEANNFVERLHRHFLGREEEDVSSAGSFGHHSENDGVILTIMPNILIPSTS